MSWRRVAPEQIANAVDALIAGQSVKGAAVAAGVTTSTLARWAVCGAPVAAPGIPARTPLLVAAARRRAGQPTDTPVTEVEQLALLNFAAARLARAADEFVKMFGQPEAQ